MDKGKGKAGQPAPTAAASASAAEGIVMKDWSPYEDLSDFEKEAEELAPRGALTRTVRMRPTVTPAAPPAVTEPTGTATSHRALVVHGIGCQQSYSYNTGCSEVGKCVGSTLAPS